MRMSPAFHRSRWNGCRLCNPPNPDQATLIEKPQQKSMRTRILTCVLVASLWSPPKAEAFTHTNDCGLESYQVFTIAVNALAPAAPTGLSATAASSSQINLTWSASSGATSYNVKRSSVSGGPYTTVASGITSTNHGDAGLSASTAYYYVVSAANANGESADSTQASATSQTSPPQPPVGLSQRRVTNRSRSPGPPPLVPPAIT